MVMWTNLLLHCRHIDLENMLTYVLYVEKQEEAHVQQWTQRLRWMQKSEPSFLR